jgi:hypothetical protein
MRQQLAQSAQVREYAQAIDRESARETLAARSAPQSAAKSPARDTMRSEPPPRPRGRAAKEPASAFEQILKSPVTRTVAGAITRGLMGALLGSSGRRRR